jgi:hypothetical protein
MTATSTTAAPTAIISSRFFGAIAADRLAAGAGAGRPADGLPAAEAGSAAASIATVRFTLDGDTGILSSAAWSAYPNSRVVA